MLGCPFGAKSSTDLTAIARAERTGRLTLVSNARLVHIESDARGRIAGFVYRHDQVLKRATGRRYILALGAIETPRILLASANTAHPDGIGNNNGLVGRYLMDTVFIYVPVQAPFPVASYMGPPLDASIWDFNRPAPGGIVRTGYTIVPVGGLDHHPPVQYPYCYCLWRKRIYHTIFARTVFSQPASGRTSKLVEVWFSADCFPALFVQIIGSGSATTKSSASHGMHQIRTYTPDDRTQVAALFNRLWSNDVQQNEAYLVWRYEQNPYIRDSLAVAEADGRIVAVRGGYGMKWRIGGATELIPCLGDTIVDRQHEGRQLVQKLSRHLFAELAEKGARYVVNQSPGKLVEKISLRTGWQRVGFRSLTKYLDPDSETQDFGTLDSRTPVSNGPGALRIEVSPGLPDGIADVLRERKTHPPVGHCVDAEYLRWRFMNPFSEYRWICAYHRDDLAGFLLLARNAIARMKNRFRILDLWGADSTTQATLLRHTLETGDIPNLLLWWNRFPRQVTEVLMTHGFKAASRELRNPTVLIRAIGDTTEFTANGTNLLDIRNWDARMIHSDVA